MPTQPEYDKPHPSTVRDGEYHPWCWNRERPERWPVVVKKYVTVRHDEIHIERSAYPDPMSTICHVGRNDNLAECEGCMHHLQDADKAR